MIPKFFALTITLFLIATVFGAPQSPRVPQTLQNHVNRTNVAGFNFLGTIPSNLSQQPFWSYYISTVQVSWSGALGECLVNFQGRLLTIYNRDEDEFIRIRLRLQAEGLGSEYENVWSSGKYNVQTSKWEWASTGVGITYENWAEPPIVGAGRCLCVVGELSSYGWVSDACATTNYFICQF